MEITSSTVSAIASCLAVFVSIVIVLRNSRDKRFDEIKLEIRDLKSDMKKGFEILDDKIERVHYEVVDIGNRVYFLEGCLIHIDITPSSQSPSSRSQAAKNSWDTRRNKLLQKKSNVT